MNTGKRIRMNSIFRKDTGRTVVVAIDHGGIAGPMEGINHPGELISCCSDSGADAVLTTRGFARAAASSFDRGLGLILRLTGGFTVLGGKFEEEMISTAETALRFGACGAAVTVKFGHPREGYFTRQASLTADSCEQWELPMLIEAIPAGAERKPSDPDGVKLAARAAAEIGADVVKTYYCGDPDLFSRVVEGCLVPIVILGGAKTDSIEQIMTEVYYSVQAGGAGIAMGRNIWQYRNPAVMIEAMAGVVHEGWTVSQALKHLGNSQKEI